MQVPNRTLLTFTLYNTYGEESFSYTANLLDLANKRITFSYLPDTPDDEALINYYGYPESVPPYLIYLRPILKIEGQIVATGIAKNAGERLEFELTFDTLGLPIDKVTHLVTLGEYTAVGLNLQKTPVDYLKTRGEAFPQSIPTSLAYDPVVWDNFVGEYFYLVSQWYLAEKNLYNKILARLNKIVIIKQPAELLISERLKVSHLFLTPFAIDISSVYVDVGKLNYTPFHKANDQSQATKYSFFSGHFSSLNESGILERYLRLPAVSTIKIFQLANAQNIPIYNINSNNLSTSLNQLSVSPEVKDDIRNAVNAGKTVFVPQTEIQDMDWHGVGYAIIDPETGAGNYMISGGIAGGEVEWVLSSVECLKSIASLMLGIVSITPWVSGFYKPIILDLITFFDTIVDATDIMWNHAIKLLAGIGVMTGIMAAVATFIAEKITATPFGAISLGISAAMFFIISQVFGQTTELILDCSNIIFPGCDEGDPCTIDYHHPITGECIHAPDPSPECR